MADLGARFTTAKDTRKVIKNATKDIDMPDSTGKTIMNTEEIQIKENKPVLKKAKPQVQSTPKVTQQPPQQQGGSSANIGQKMPQMQISGSDTLGVNGLQGIKVNVEGQNNPQQQDSFINQNGRATDLKKFQTVDVDGVIDDLFLDVGQGLAMGTLQSTPVANIKALYPELGALDDKTVTDLVSDMASMHQQGLKLNDTNLEKLKSLYPEFTAVSMGFAQGAPYNMYQAGGIREVMNAETPLNLNQYGTAGTVAETVLNPLGQGLGVVDAASQTIPQVDSSKEFTGTPALKRRLQELTQEDIDNYYKKYQEYQKQHGTLSKLYTTRVEGKNLLEQWANIFKGNTKQNADAGFRQWMIDQVNNEVNGWKGEFWGAANELEGIGGPNVAKLIANVPASTVKTVTAIAKAITNPVDTAGGLYMLAKDAIQHANDGTFKDSILGQRYGSWDALAKAMEQDPVGVASDALTIVEGGANVAGTTAKLAKWGTRGASLATYALGAERTSSGLFRIANRLEKFEGRMGELARVSNSANNLGVGELLYGKNYSKGLKDGGLIGGLRKWGEEGDGFLNKGATYLAEHTTAKPALDAAKKVTHPAKTIAEKITGTTSDEGKLLQAASPNINKLTKGVDYANKKANMDLATKSIVEAGYTPKTIAEWADAHVKTLDRLWKEFTKKVQGKADVTVDANKVIESTQAYIDGIGDDITVNQRSDVRALQREVDALKKRGNITMDSLENLKEMFNAETRNKTHTAKGDIYIRGLKELSKAIGEIQNRLLSDAPDEVKALKKKIGALLDTKEDVQKANLRQLKKKEGGGLIENYSRIEGLGDIIGGVMKGDMAEAGKGVGKLILGRALGKAKDVDFLTEQGFKGLSKKVNKNKGKLAEKGGATAKKGEKEGVKFKKDVEGGNKKAAVDNEQDYADALNAAYRKNKQGDRVSTENKDFEISKDSKVYKDIAPKAENVGFVTKIVDNINDALKKAGEGEDSSVKAFTDFRQKLINLTKNPGDTTLQHEFYHAVMSVLDPETKKYVLDQAKNFLSAELGRKVGDIAAEEWLAESFGVYIRDKQINLGILENAKGISGLKQRLNRLYQRAYEWMQNYNTDRFTLNKIFNEIYNGNYKIDDKGVLDLSYLWKQGGDNGGLGRKRTLGGGNGGGVAFKKTVSPRYKKDINGKEVQIDTKATSPDQLAKVNSEGLSVMKSFISERQAEKALNVSKELLTKDGDAYLWTHTNKYDDNQFAAFGNVKDSRYKEFTDQGREIAWFSNSEAMSKSYADQESKLANTKSFKNVDELNKYLKDNPKVIKDTWEDLDYTKKSYNTERIFNYDVSPMKGRDGKTYWGLYKTFTDKKIYPDLDTAWAIERNQPFFNTLGDMPASKEEALKALKNKLGDVEIKEKDGKLEISSVYDREYVEGYDTEKEALAEGFAITNPRGKYHYQGIIQDMKKPLVIEANSTWNDIGRADSVAMAEYPNIEKTFKAINDKMADAQRGKKKFDTMWGEKINDKKWELQGEVEKLERGTKERDLAVDKVTELRVARDKINNLFNGIDEKLTPQERAIQINDKWNMGDAYDEAKKIYNEHKDVYDIYNRFASTDETGIRKENILNNDFMDFLRKQEGIDDGIMSLLYNSDINLQDINWFATDITGNPFMNALENKRMSTNDFVFFALRKGGYDGVVFKNISDLGGVVDDATIDGDVVAAFNSKQFKAWDNANPTDSKYISYKKDIRDLTLNNEKKEGAYDPRASLPKPRGGWTKEKITKQIKNPQTASQVGTLAALQAIQEFDSPEDFRAHTFYHGTQGWFAGKPSMSIPEKTFDKMADSFGGGYGQRYWAISLTTDKKIASNFGGASDHVNIYPVILRKNANVIEMPKLEDAADLDDHIVQLWNDGVDAVWIGDKNSGEKELAVINPRAIVDLDAPDRYRQYHLGMEDNPLRIKSDADFDRIYENAPKYRQELRDKERAYRGLKDKYFQDNYGETQMGLMDKDYKAYQEAKSKWETSPEKAKYDEGKREYEGLKYNIKNEIKFKKDVSSDGKKLSEGQMEYFKDSKVRDKYGRLAPVYHFTADDFNTVDFKKGSQNLFWFTSDGTASDRAMGIRPGMQRKRKDMYVDIKNPAGWEEYNKFGTDELKYRGYDGVILKNRDGSFEGFIFDKENQVKYTDNLNPTSSKDMRFKKDTGLDAEYEKAVKEGDNEKAMGMLRKAAAEKGYNSSSDYQGSKAFNGSAPSSEGYTKAERVKAWKDDGDMPGYSQTLGDFASDGVDMGDLEWQLDPNGGLGIARARASKGLAGAIYDLESINNLRNAVIDYKNGNKDAKIRMYRAIDADIKEEGFRNGDWITPSKEYAKHHIDLQDWKKGRIISEEVPIEHIWWDNNDINEWGYDDGKDYGYKNTKNNRKELGITRDDKGGLIPLSKRFDENNPDIRYKKGLQKKESGLKQKYNVPQENYRNIINHISSMRNSAARGGVNVGKYTKAGPIENAINNIFNINKKKNKVKGKSNYDALLQSKEDGLLEIAKVLDGGYKDENIHYGWFHDYADPEHPTIIFWKGDDIKKSKTWAQHLDKTPAVKASLKKFRLSDGKLPKSPLRKKKRGGKKNKK